MILRKVAVFSPASLTHYLNITVNNVVRIFGKDTVAVRSGVKSSITDFGKDNPNASGGDRSRSQPIRNDESQSAKASQVGHDLEHRVAPRDCNRSREEATHLNDIAGSTSVSSIPTDLRGEFQVEVRGSQEAMAKAAGWDLDEDIELLFADDFPFDKS